LVEEMKKKHADSFQQWMLYLSEGTNLLLCGFGSKLDLLEEFRQRKLMSNGYTHIVLHGYRPDVSVKQLLNNLKTNFELDVPERFKSGRHGLVQRAREICDAIKARDSPDFVILIHSIDGLTLRDEESQTALSYLAELPTCRIIASVDHVNGSLLWDRDKSTRFKWLSIDATTYANYFKEIDGQGSKILGLSKKANASDASHTLKGLMSIWSSLNKNAQSIFTKLAKCQLTKRKGRGLNLMTFLDLFSSCREDFVVSSEAALRQILTEFHDHNLLKTRINMDEQEVLSVNVHKELLIEFLSTVGVDIGEADQTIGNDSSLNETINSLDSDGDKNENVSAESSDDEDIIMDEDGESDDALSDMSF